MNKSYISISSSNKSYEGENFKFLEKHGQIDDFKRGINESTEFLFCIFYVKGGVHE